MTWWCCACDCEEWGGCRGGDDGVLGEVFVEGADDVGFWATCTKRSMISCAISGRGPNVLTRSRERSPRDNALTFQMVYIDVELILPFPALRQ